MTVSLRLLGFAECGLGHWPGSPGGELTAVSVRDTEFLVKFEITPANSGSYAAGIRARWESGPDYYLIKLNYNSTHPAGQQRRSYSVANGTATDLNQNTAAGFVPTQNVANTVWMRVRVTGGWHVS